MLQRARQMPVLNSVGSVVFVCVSFLFCLSLSAEEPVANEVNFNRDIRPIFNKHCTSCHGGVKQAADVSFVYAEQVVAPEGWVVEPGEPDDSLLLERIKSDDPDEVMPPPDHGAALTAEEIDVLTRWIEQGAKWTQHWAFEKPQRSALPETKDKSWARQSIDHFVLAKLESNKLAPALAASPERWLRRASLDLTGLPPTLEERSEFLTEIRENTIPADKEKVYANAVDRLLASPAFGERWASVWLDQVRYADSKGLGLDGPRNIWKYRDWVIDAFNDDMPFDEFTIKQLAGDLLEDASIEDYVATAAHRLTQTNEEGGTDDEEFRIAAVLDRTNTTWQAWQGITFGCVQCHSHPYDPIRHDEYYKFAAFFNNTADTDLGEDWPVLQVPYAKSDYEKASILDREIGQLKETIWKSNFETVQNAKWLSVDDMEAKTNNQTKVAIEPKANHVEFHTVDTVSTGTAITLTASVPLSLQELSAIRLTLKPLEPAKAALDSEWGFSLSHVTAGWVMPGEEPTPLEIVRLIGDEADPFYDPQQSLKAKSKQGFAAYTRIYKPRVVALVLKEAAAIPEGAKLQVVLKQNAVALGAFPLVTKRGHLAVTDSSAFVDLAYDDKFIAKQRSLRAKRQQRSQIKSTSVPVFKERPSHLARTQQVFVRGLYLDKDKTVAADTPEAFRSLRGKENSRLELAQWMVSPENTLTSRVAVNRLWARLFGNGLVATEEDFGSSGDAPSHPQLLDHLALKFQNEYQWSQKQLLRELVLSSTYRQSSAIRPELQKFDSANRLLARGPRSRLSSEVVRDQALAVSGLLSRKMYGHPVRPPIPNGVWRPFAGHDKWDTPDRDSEDRYRRAIYTYTKRSIPYPMFAAFDAPSREVCAPRRLLSNTPIQALMSLNDQTMVECGEAFAKRMMDIDGELKGKLRIGFLLATCREPDEEEIATLEQLLDSFGDRNNPEGWQAVASVLLNLDEVLAK